MSTRRGRCGPATERAQRRVDAEARLRWYGRAFGARVSLLRVPGIYAADRAGGHPRERLARATPVLAPADDVYTNHIHADDLARACVAALHRGLPQRAVNVSDDSEIKMGDYFDLAADLCGLPRPPRIARAEAEGHLSPMALSFMSESRRLVNTRLVRELRVAPALPSGPRRAAGRVRRPSTPRRRPMNILLLTHPMPAAPFASAIRALAPEPRADRVPPGPRRRDAGRDRRRARLADAARRRREDAEAALGLRGRGRRRQAARRGPRRRTCRSRASSMPSRPRASPSSS